jgi:hypothetical protein
MWDFDGDEVAFLVFAGIVTLIFGVKYFLELLKVSELVCPFGKRVPLLMLPFFCLLMVLIVLWSWSDVQNVRGHPDYETLFAVGGTAWIFGTAFKLRFFGFTIRDDAVERKNTAVTIVASGAILGHTLCYAGANIGGGPTIWTTIVPAIVASGILAILWMAIEVVTRVSETIAIDRDIPTALVLASFLLLAGLNLGWAASGDFQDWNSTMNDFPRRGWPAVLLAIFCGICIQIWKPRCNLVPNKG